MAEAIPPIVVGYDWAATITLSDDGVPRNLTGQTYRAQFYFAGNNPSASVSPSQVLLDLSTASSGFSIVDAANGQMGFALSGSTQTPLLDPAPLKLPGPQSKITLRLSRTDSGLNQFVADVPLPLKA